MCEPGSGGRHRTGAGVSGGVLAAGVVLAATSAAAPAVAPSGPPNAPQPVDQERAVVADHRGGNWIPDRIPTEGPDQGVVLDADIESTVDDSGPGPMIPAVFTGDIPTTVLDAYRRARDAINLAQPGCRLPLELLAAIGKVETGHARGGQVDTNGNTMRPILGPALNGNGFAAIADTDGGALDGDTTWDRAVGPMQFIPGTWRRWASDGNGDRRSDPHNVYDASLAAARYLCAANRDLGTPEGLDAAILSYNHSTSYRNLVLRWMQNYRGGTVVVPDATGLPPVVIVPTVPPAGPPAAPGTTTPAPPATTAPNPPVTTTPTPPAPTTTTPAPPTTTEPPATPNTTEPPATPNTTTTAPPTTEPAPPASTEPAPPTSTTAPVTGLVGGLVCGVAGLLDPVLPACD
ncbi:MAG TPA: lytic murein transglycosylase [Actinophytocola sp.]|uniref:lytic transglycosylase domain-containing protein n=1 Tax=Actinophytocola sp. TaxID=1872138 RepID=UPI002DBB1606|nr:lytic murein transglycosylase [Actinophytocola sp.]HEU5475502.1 lytic murein transglycosylase [Actinophytocola sp.]